MNTAYARACVSVYRYISTIIVWHVRVRVDMAIYIVAMQTDLRLRFPNYITIELKHSVALRWRLRWHIARPYCRHLRKEFAERKTVGRCFAHLQFQMEWRWFNGEWGNWKTSSDLWCTWAHVRCKKKKNKKTIVNCFRFNGPTEVFLVYLFKVILLRICGMRESIWRNEPILETLKRDSN